MDSEPTTEPGTRQGRGVAFWILTAGWALATVILFIGAHNLRYGLTNTDGISYMRIAENYLAGRFGDALNAFWSPMLSWSMLPFMAFGMDSEQALEFASAAWSSIGIAIGMLFVWRWTRHNVVSTSIVGISMFALVVGNLPSLTPDLMVVTWCVGFVWALAEVNDHLGDESRGARIRWGIVLGVVLALGYFIKAYTVPVFIVVCLGWLLVRFIRQHRSLPKNERAEAAKKLFVAPIAATLVTLILIAPFAIAISVKYGTPTFGSSFAVNTQGKFTAGAKASDVDSLSLAAPPNAYAIYFGYDPTGKLTTDAASVGNRAAPKESLKTKVEYYVDQRLADYPVYLASVAANSPFTVAIAAVFVVLLLFGLINPVRQRAALITTATVIVYFVGYALLSSVATGGGRYRYHWPLLALTAITVGLLWPAVWARARAGRWWLKAAAIILVAAVPFASVRQNGMADPHPFSSQVATTSFRALLTPAGEPRDQQFAEKLLADHIVKAGDRIVSGNGMHDQTLHYAFYLRAQLYGRNEPHDINDPRFQQVMRDKGIDYFFLYTPVGSTPADVSAWGTVKARFTMPYSCEVDGATRVTTAQGTCNLEIVKVSPTAPATTN